MKIFAYKVNEAWSFAEKVPEAATDSFESVINIKRSDFDYLGAECVSIDPVARTLTFDKEKFDKEVRNVVFVDEDSKEGHETAFAILRSQAYPPIESQLDMMYHDLVSGSTTWKDAIEKVKTSIPKTEFQEKKSVRIGKKDYEILGKNPDGSMVVDDDVTNNG